MGGSRSGRYGSGRPIAEGLQRFDLAEYMRRPDAVKPYASCIATISNGKISAQIRYTETATRFGWRRLWILCPRCSRRCRVLFLGFGRVACRRCFRMRYQSQSLGLNLTYCPSRADGLPPRLTAPARAWGMCPHALQDVPPLWPTRARARFWSRVLNSSP